MRFQNKFLLGDLSNTVQVRAVTAGQRRHVSPTDLKGKRDKISHIKLYISLKQQKQSPAFYKMLNRTAGM